MIMQPGVMETFGRSVGGESQVGRIYAGTVGLLTVAFVLFAFNAWYATQRVFGNELEHANRLLRQSSEAVLAHEESVLRVLGRRLEEVDALLYPERSRHLIDQMLEINTAMAGFGLVRPDGQLVLVSGVPAGRNLPSLLDRAESREGFLSALQSDQMVIGRTYFFPLLQKWLIPVRLAMRNAAGEVVLVMAAGINIDSKEALWQAIEVKPGMQLALLRDDGYPQLVLPTSPDQREAVYAAPLTAHDGAPLMGSEDETALVRTERLGRYPLTVVTRYERQTLVDTYLRDMTMPALLYLIALAMGWLLFQYLQQKQREFEGNLIYQASHDALTGLPNRMLLEDRVMHDIARARRNKRRVAIMYLDLDQFKRVNDGFGHKTGDLMLRVCADRLLSNLRDADTVGRLGGDEFLVVLPDLSDATAVRTLAYRLLEDFRRPLRVQGRDLFSTVSIGVAVFPDDGERAEILLQNADTALYRAKDGGRDNVCFFQPQHSQAAARRTEVESALRDALVHDELSVVYQPKANGRTLQWDGAEALLRWHSGQLGDVSPAEFIPVAEDSGLIDAIGWFVIDSALRDLHRIRERVPDFGMAVNVSVRQFRDPTFIRHLLDRLHKADVPCHALELEVTESIMAEGVPELEALREAGLRLAIDDFGTGFSSLSYLKRLPVTTLKLDRAFVSDLETDNADRALITAIMAVARELDLDIVAEGVETQGQLAFLQARHCSHLQGYLLGRPMPLADLLDRLPT